jgi:hypothetical protein
VQVAILVVVDIPDPLGLEGDRNLDFEAVELCSKYCIYLGKQTSLYKQFKFIILLYKIITTF